MERETQEVVTYTVQKDDTLSGIAEIISTTVTTIENFNKHLTKDPSYIDVGWVLFVPREKIGTPAPRKSEWYSSSARSFVTQLKRLLQS